MTQRLKKNMHWLEELSLRLTTAVGTPASIVWHTILFVGIFALLPLGVSLDSVLLILTTLVSLEAIYLAIFIQMTVNRTTKALESVEQDIEEIQGDVETIQTEVGEIEGDVDAISRDVGEIGADVEGISADIERLHDHPHELHNESGRDLSLLRIEEQLRLILHELEDIKKRQS